MSEAIFRHAFRTPLYLDDIILPPREPGVLKFGNINTTAKGWDICIVLLYFRLFSIRVNTRLTFLYISISMLFASAFLLSESWPCLIVVWDAYAFKKRVISHSKYNCRYLFPISAGDDRHVRSALTKKRKRTQLPLHVVLSHTSMLPSLQSLLATVPYYNVVLLDVDV